MEQKFSGTSLAGEHIGDKQSDNLAALASTPATEFVDFELTAGAEAANAITVAIQAKTLGGKNLAEAVQMHCRLYSATMIEALAAAAKLTASGGAAVDTTANQAAALITLGSDGSGNVIVTDVSAALAGDLILEITPTGRGGIVRHLTLTFA